METKNSYMHSLIASELNGGKQSVSHSKSSTHETKIHCGLAGPVWTQRQSEEVPLRGKAKWSIYLFLRFRKF